jgi:hypothetical protein
MIGVMYNGRVQDFYILLYYFGSTITEELVDIVITQ